MIADLDQARAIFIEALGQVPADQWEAFLAARCGDDAELQRHVHKLLQVHVEAGSFLDRPAVAAERTGEHPPQADDDRATHADSRVEPGTVIGPYKLLEQIGEGGMGTVWMAQQTEPVKRLVAVKLIKAGMDSRQVIARFEAERQALALMDHPHIARVLDAGTTSAGRPYFVMDLVKGVPITKYCDEHRLTPRQRLELFVPVCQAVQHAHQKGIIHRDLKPSNVLVALYDGKPVPKVIDFGVAKAAGQPLTEKTLVTGFGSIVGTLEYMSPEQAEINQLDIDTRSDIYSLGVLLYELLAGTTPLERQRAREAGLLEALRIIREEETPRPSARLSTTQEMLTIATCRGMEPRKLSGLLRGELDWVVMRCLEKDRNRRYETANALAADLARYLADEPVHVCPPSAWYRLRKFVRRNKARVAIAACLLLLLTVLAGGIGWVFGDRTTRQREAAKAVHKALDEVRQLQAQGRWREARATVHGAEALLDSTGGSAELWERCRQARADMEMLEKLEHARLRHSSMWAGPGQSVQIDPLASGLLYTLAFQEYGLPVLELESEETAQRIAASAIAPELVAALVQWAMLSTPNLADRNRLLTVARLAEPGGVAAFLSPLDQDTLEQMARKVNVNGVQQQRPGVLLLLAKCLRQQGGATHLAFLRRVRQACPGDVWANLELAVALATKKPPEMEEAVRYYTAAVALRPESSPVHSNLGIALYDSGKVDEAIACLHKAIELDPRLATPHNTLGAALKAKGKVNDAIACYKRAIDLDPRYPHPHSNLGDALKDQGKVDEAIAWYKRAIECDPKFAQAHNNLATTLGARGRIDEAIACLRKAIECDSEYAAAHSNLGTALYEKREVAAASASYRKAIALDPKDANAHYGLGNTLRAEGRLDAAIACCRQAITLDPKHAPAHHNLAGLLWDAKRDYDGAIAHWRQAIVLDPKAETHFNLGIVLSAKGQLDEAIACYRQAITLDPKHAPAHHNLGVALKAKGQVDEAIACYRKALALDPKLAMVRSNLARAERLAAARDKLPAFCKGDYKPTSNDERLALAESCQRQQLHRAAAGLYADAFAADPELADDLDAAHRYNAACHAALAGCGQGKDAACLGEMDRAGWRKQALAWLRADLEVWRRALDQDPNSARAAVRQRMQHWLKDPDFVGVRSAEALAKLPEAEWPGWLKLWSDIADTLNLAQGKAASPRKTAPK